MNTKILKFQTENTKRLRVVEITPDGNLIVIGGKNGAGKSSVLDSIEMTMRGGDAIPPMPVRKGAEKARTVIELEDLIVTRTFTAVGGTSLVVKTRDGVTQKTPQAILDALVGKLSFDPLAFAREPVKKQAETLRALTGLDFAALDADKNKLVNERLLIGREKDTAKGALDSCPKVPDAPKEEQSAAAILEEQGNASDANARNQKKREEENRIRVALQNASKAAEDQRRWVEQCEADVDAANKKLTEAKRRRSDLVVTEGTEQKKLDEATKANAKLQDKDLSVFKTQIAAVEANNTKVRQNKRHAELADKYKAKAKAYDDLTRKIEAIDERKRTETEAAKMPVPGLSFTSIGGVALNGIPLEQASSAEQLRVSVAIGLALNPKLRVLLIRDGSLLDDDSMKALAGMAKEADAQVWLERVETDGHTSVVIEDGQVAAELPTAEEGELI